MEKHVKRCEDLVQKLTKKSRNWPENKQKHSIYQMSSGETTLWCERPPLSSWMLMFENHAALSGYIMIQGYLFRPQLRWWILQRTPLFAILHNVVCLSNQYVPAKTETRIWMPQKPWCSGPPLDCHQQKINVRPMVGPVVSALIFSNTWQHVAVLSPVPWLAAWKVFCHPKRRVAKLQPINQLYNRYPSAIPVGSNSSRATGNLCLTANGGYIWSI